MKLPFLWLSLGFSAGLLAYPYLGEWNYGLGLGGLFLLPFLWASRGKVYFLTLLTVVVFALGLSFSHLDRLKSNRAIENWADGRKAALFGTVQQDPEVTTKGKRVKASFVLKVHEIILKNDFEREAIKAEGLVQVHAFQPSFIPEIGDKIRLYGKLEKPKLLLNPGGFDYGRYLWAKNVSCLLYSYGGPSLKLIKKGPAYSLAKGLHQIRRFISQRMDQIFSEPYDALYQALLLGKRKELDETLRDDFLKTGTSHLLAISGLNVALVAGSFFVLILFLGGGQKVAAALGLMVTIFYVFIAGAGIPVQRAGWMAGAGFFALLMERERSSLNTFFMAFFILILFDARSLYQISFQLSFLSVFCLILFYRYQDPWIHRMDSLLQSLIVLIGTFPIVLYHFNLFSPISLLANLGAVPLMHLGLLSAMAALATSSIPLLGVFWIRISEGLGWAALSWIQLFARFEWGYIYFPSPPLERLCLYYLLALILVLLQSYSKDRFRKIILGAKLTLAGLWFILGASFLQPVKPAGLHLTMFAAGQNEIFHLATGPNADWLLNTGRRHPSDQAQWIVGPFLKSRGRKKLKGIILTDGLRRHSGGLEPLRRNFKWDYLIAPQEEIKRINLSPVKNRQLKKILLEKNRVWNLSSQVTFQVLEKQKNDSMLHFDFGGVGILWMSRLKETFLEETHLSQDKKLAVEILLLSSEAEKELGGRLEELLNQWDPSMIAAPFSNEKLEEELKERDILFLHPDRYGALQFTFEKGRPVRVYSFLKGEITD